MVYLPNLVAAIMLCFLLSSRVNSEPTQDKQALLAFLIQTPHANRLQWNASDSACNWVGVGCDPTKSFVETLRLPGVGLVGPIPAATIGRLTQLRVLSLRSNRISSPLPSDLSNLTLLRSLYLQNNALSGEFPSFVPSLSHLSRLDISSNTFSGPIPFAINNLTRLTGLFLQNNNFSGSLPSITSELVGFNVSNNKLNGSIPDSLSKFPASAFSGNLDLCGGPLRPCNPFFVPPSPSPASELPQKEKKSKGLSTGAIVGIVVGCALFLILLLVLLFLCLRRRKQRQPPKPAIVTAARAVAVEAGTSSSKDDITGKSSSQIPIHMKINQAKLFKLLILNNSNSLFH